MEKSHKAEMEEDGMPDAAAEVPQDVPGHAVEALAFPDATTETAFLELFAEAAQDPQPVVTPTKSLAPASSPGKAQISICKFFGIPTPKLQRSAADRLAEAQAEQEQLQLVSSDKLSSPDGTTSSLKKGGSGGRHRKDDPKFLRGSQSDRGGNNSRKPNGQPCKYEPGASVALP